MTRGAVQAHRLKACALAVKEFLGSFQSGSAASSHPVYVAGCMTWSWHCLCYLLSPDRSGTTPSPAKGSRCLGASIAPARTAVSSSLTFWSNAATKQEFAARLQVIATAMHGLHSGIATKSKQLVPWRQASTWPT